MVASSVQMVCPHCLNCDPLKMTVSRQLLQINRIDSVVFTNDSVEIHLGRPVAYLPAEVADRLFCKECLKSFPILQGVEVVYS